MGNQWDLIESLQEKECMIIDVFPKQIHKDIYFEVEKFYMKKYLKPFAKKMSRIIMQIMCYFDLEIYFTEFPEEQTNGKYASLINTDLTSLKLNEINKIIHCVICDEISSLKIVIPDCSFLISIDGGFQVSLYNISGEYLDLIRKIVEKENLYFRKP